MNHLTNGRFRHVVHRVPNPPAAEGGSEDDEGRRCDVQWRQRRPDIWLRPVHLPGPWVMLTAFIRAVGGLRPRSLPCQHKSVDRELGLQLATVCGAQYLSDVVRCQANASTVMKRKSAMPFKQRLSWKCYGGMPHPDEAGLQKAGPSPDYGLTA